jgi:phage baseplate assembly protein gpV
VSLIRDIELTAFGVPGVVSDRKPQSAGGRPKSHESAAAKQNAYRQRKKAEQAKRYETPHKGEATEVSSHGGRQQREADISDKRGQTQG